ncbi:MAG: DegV family protein [Lachnospiraceae bacterium]|nr:DegV family protein [Lachnospiraceae bacterium]
MYVIFTDTDTDMTPKEAEKYGYHLISMPYSIDGRTTYPYVDFDEFDPHAFYQQLRDGALPNTSAISEEQYIQYFEPFFAEGKDILYVHFSRAMSATFENMDRAVARLKEEYPERSFYTVDTKGISLVSLNIVKEVGDMYLAGRTPQDILVWAEEEVDRFAVYFFADDLKFFHHSGRVSGLSATMGTLLGIRPIIYMDQEGKMVSIGKEKGRRKAIDHLVSRVEELGDNIRDHRILIGAADNQEIIDQLVEELTRRLGPDLPIELADVNPTAGSHCGPDTMGICFHAVHR